MTSLQRPGRQWMRLLAACLAAWLLLSRPSPALAHSGAPYPVLLEERVGPYVASALADPDVGTGTFYLLVEMPDKTPAPAGTTVTLWARPQDGHAAETAHQAERQQTRYGERYVVKVPFDTRGEWQMRLVIDGSAGQGESAFPLQVTPKGISWLTTLICLLPFLALGGLWLWASRRSRAAAVTAPRAAPPGPPAPDPDNGSHSGSA